MSIVDLDAERAARKPPQAVATIVRHASGKLEVVLTDDSMSTVDRLGFGWSLQTLADDFAATHMTQFGQAFEAAKRKERFRKARAAIRAVKPQV